MFPFRITYQLSVKSFLWLSLVNRYRHWSMVMVNLVGWFILAIGIIFHRPSDILMGIAFLLVPLAWLVIRTFMIFKRYPYLKDNMTYEFNEDNVLVSTDGRETRIAWQKFQQIKTAAGFITIHLSAAEGVILPLDLFEPAQLNAVRKKIKK